jgi:hypothetical protein
MATTDGELGATSATQAASAVDAAARRALLEGTYRVLPGLYAWALTVLAPAAARSAPTGARVMAALALLLLIAGPLLHLRRAALGRALGIHGFVGASVLCWVLLDGFAGVQRLDPVRAALGAVGWALFAVGWGRMRETGSVPEKDPHVVAGPALPPRGALPRWANAAFAVALVGAIAPPLLAWRVARADHAVFAHAAAVAGSMALLTVGARVATERQAWQPPDPRYRLAAATPALVTLAVTLGFGVLLLLITT